MEFTHPRDQLPQDRIRLGAIVEVLAGALPLIGLVSLLLRSQLDPHLENYRLHFILFGLAGTLAFVLGYAAGEAAKRRGDARVLLLSLAFMATGGFMGLHALGTQGVLFTGDHSGFKVAIPVGLVVSAVFAAGSAFVDLRPSFAPLVVRHQNVLRAFVLLAMGTWFVWTVANVPPLDGAHSEAARGMLLTVFAIVGTVVYAVSAARYWRIFRARPNVLPAAVIACFVLLSEALIGVALTGERKWHASWWEWHFLIVTAFVVIGLAARREWREERFGDLYLSSTRERRQNVSVLFSDLVGYTSFAARSTPVEAAAVLETYWRTASNLLSRRFGGVVEKFIGDGVVAVFNRGGNQPDHARRAACAALALRDAFGKVADEHPEWPRMRVGVNTGEAVVREIGGAGHLAYPLVGDTINMGARLEGLAPVGGVLIGTETYEQLPDGAVVEARSGLQVKGKDEAVDAYVLHTCPC
ncbi:MAG TPA: adenylate/guanylate cyclase domain-containing protein [Gaiellaceae bacterium]